MAVFSIKHISLKGVAAAVPKAVEYNADYTYVAEAERNLFMQTTGVHERRIAPDPMCTSDMCYAAAEKLLADLGWRKDEIELLVFVSQSPDYYLPASGGLIQHRLGLSKRAMVFDISQGCSGYVYGLSVVSSIMSATGIKKALLLAGDKSTFSLNKRDKITYPLFGDAGTATALQYEAGNEWFFNLQTDGGGKDAIIVPGGGTRQPFNLHSLDEKEIQPGVIRHSHNLHLNGMDVFNFALREVAPNIKEMLQHAGKNSEDADHYLFHQANRLILESVRKKMKLPSEKVPYSIVKFGNTSSASIPLTMVHNISQALTSGRQKLVMSGFGVGLSWGSVYMETDAICCSPLIELE